MEEKQNSAIVKGVRGEESIKEIRKRCAKTYDKNRASRYYLLMCLIKLKRFFFDACISRIYAPSYSTHSKPNHHIENTQSEKKREKELLLYWKSQTEGKVQPLRWMIVRAAQLPARTHSCRAWRGVRERQWFTLIIIIINNNDDDDNNNKNIQKYAVT